MKALIFLIGLLALPAIAESPMTAAEFDAYTRGKTLYYGTQGERYGVEEYLPDRRVRWSFLDGKCKDGFWYEEADLICFVYEDGFEPQCWSFYKRPGGLSARFENSSDATELYEVEGEGEMLCLGPEVGV
ncbi:hypothetical protein [uncultured Shimia sp.]|uniref:hypothetical protein n=1 Tax=uncultured Shimia sp. TaxID=573152 RepID=UPI00260831C8|nr:hypothetical protein [uncultured Shimia sp.]